MNAILKKMLELAKGWSEEDQEELAKAGLKIEARRAGDYHATEEELRAIDEGVAAAERGALASDEQVNALFAKFRRS